MLLRGHQGDIKGNPLVASQPPSQDMRCFLPTTSRGASLELRAHAASMARAWPEASGSARPRKSLRAPDGDAEVFPASFLLSAVALAFCTAGPKCVFHGVRAQRRTGRGCSRVLLGSLPSAPLLNWLHLGLVCGVASVQDSKRPRPSKQAVGQCR